MCQKNTRSDCKYSDVMFTWKFIFGENNMFCGNIVKHMKYHTAFLFQISMLRVPRSRHRAWRVSDTPVTNKRFNNQEGIDQHVPTLLVKHLDIRSTCFQQVVFPQCLHEVFFMIFCWRNQLSNTRCRERPIWAVGWPLVLLNWFPQQFLPKWSPFPEHAFPRAIRLWQNSVSFCFNRAFEREASM